jgi:hypothetical protein
MAGCRESAFHQVMPMAASFVLQGGEQHGVAGGCMDY